MGSDLLPAFSFPMTGSHGGIWWGGEVKRRSVLDLRGIGNLGEPLHLLPQHINSEHIHGERLLSGTGRQACSLGTRRSIDNASQTLRSGDVRADEDQS